MGDVIEVNPGCVNGFLCDCGEDCPGHCTFCGDPVDYCSGHSQQEWDNHYSGCRACAEQVGFENTTYVIHFIPNRDGFIALTSTCLVLVDNMQEQEFTYDRAKTTCPDCLKIFQSQESPVVRSFQI